MRPCCSCTSATIACTRSGIAHVHRDAARLAAGRADLRRGGVHALLLAAGEHDVGAEGGEEIGDAAADAAAAAGDERHLPVEQPGDGRR